MRFSLAKTNAFTMIESVPFGNSTEFTFAYDAYVRFALSKENYDEAISPGEAQDIFVDNIASDRSVSGRLCENILENVDVIRGIYLQDSGDVYLGQLMCTTDHLPVFSGNLYALEIMTKVTSATTGLYSRICCYDADKTFISTIGRMTIGHETDNNVFKVYKILSIPERCAYIRISYPFDAVDTITLSGYSATDQIARQDINNQERKVSTLGAEKYALKKNNPDMVADMISVAQSYKGQRNDSGYVMHYGVNTPLSTTYQNDGAIDCSTFLGFVLRGIRFEESPYVVDYPASALNPFDPSQFGANPECIWAINPAKFEYDLVQDVDYPEYAEARRASQIAQMFAEQGREVPLDRHMNNLEAGDFIFFAAKNEDGSYKQPGRYRNISHIALLIDVSDAPDGATWDTDAYPYAHTYIDVSAGGNTDPVRIKVLEELPMVETSSSLASLRCAFRPDLGSINFPVIAGKKLIFNDDGTVTWESV